MKFRKKIIEKALAEKPWVTKRGPNLYRVVPRRQRDGRIEHGKYELGVEFDSEGMPEVASCRDYRKDKPCQGFYFNDQCYHAAALVIHLLKKIERIAA